ncbi:hypothetical protein [Methylovorus menthalis]|uniref:hypothetical protein n=1 Tax=Methylovorus menthalis TaxID=1002227 RepID=UPI001E4798B7|nr:hypothetical protein [Methylovorus menthalis]
MPIKNTKSVFNRIFDQGIGFKATFGTLAASSGAIVKRLVIRMLDCLLLTGGSTGIADFSAYMACHKEIG